jgi:hypothetical protein
VGEQPALGVVDRALQQGLPDPLGDDTPDLVLDQGGVDCAASVLHGEVA